MDSNDTYGLQPILTVEEVADFLRCNRKTVYSAIEAKQLPGRRVGKKVVIMRDVLLTWLGGEESGKVRRK